ncbi:tetratricopeptide repeat protein [bacterium]|nr:tetratricopeptide repeat protein [bacterium]
MTARLGVFVITLLFFSALSAADSPDKTAAKTIDAVRESLKEIESFCDKNIKRTVSYEASAADDRDLTGKMKKGRIFFENGKYDTASDLFYSVVALHPDNDAMRSEALLMLAESLYRQKNYISSARYYEMLLSATGNRDYMKKSLIRIVESNYYLGNYSAAKKYYDTFFEAAVGTSDSELSYYLGRSLFYGKRFSEAVSFFYAVEKKSEFYPQARYFLGMLSLKEGEYDDAFSFFEEIVELKDSGFYHKFDEIREKAFLAAARAAFKTGDFEKASRYYRMTDKRSPFFAEACFELALACIKSADYKGAIDALHLIKQVAPHSAFIPKAEVLERTVLVRTKRYGEAAALFDSAVKKYGKIQDELFVVDGGMFMSGQSKRVSDFLMPYSLLVQSLLKDNRKFKKAVKLNESAEILESELSQLHSRERKLAAALYSKNIAAVYPPLIESARKTLFLRDRIAVIRSNLAMMQKSSVEKVLDEAGRREFGKLDAEKRNLLGISESFVSNPAKIRERAEEYGGRVAKNDAELRKISMDLASMAKDLEAVSAFYGEDRMSAENDEKKFLNKVVSERDALRDMVLEADSCGTELEKEKNSIVSGGGTEAREIAIRERLNQITDRQYAVAKPKKKSEIHRLMGEADRIDRKLADYYDSLNGAVRELFDTIRISFEKEKIEIDAYRSELAGIRREVDEMSVLAMYSDLNAVKTAVASYFHLGESGLSEISGRKKIGNSDKIFSLEFLKSKELQQFDFDSDMQ